MTNFYNTIEEVRRIAAASLPEGVARRISNHLNKAVVVSRRYERTGKALAAPVAEDDPNFTSQQIADRYIAKKAIFDALTKGRRISFLDSREFNVSEMHTQMHCIRQDIEDKNLPYTLHSRWIGCGLAGKRCKEYWLEDKTEDGNEN